MSITRLDVGLVKAIVFGIMLPSTKAKAVFISSSLGLLSTAASNSANIWNKV